jgi:hypothetical protein
VVNLIEHFLLFYIFLNIAMEEPLSGAEVLLHVVEHVFLPPSLPQRAPSENHEWQIDRELVCSVVDSVESYRNLLSDSTKQWLRMSRMLSIFAGHVEFPPGKEELQQGMAGMKIGGMY